MQCFGKLIKWSWFAAALVLTIGTAHAQTVLRLQEGKIVVARELRRSPQAASLKDTALANNRHAIRLSREAWLDGQTSAPLKLNQGTLQFWLYPLDWAQGEGWRVLLNWRSVLSGPDTAFDSLWVRSDPKGNIVFLLGNIENKKWDILQFPLPAGATPQWTNIAITWDKDNLQAYVNGVKATQKARVHQSPLTLGRNFKLGGPHGSGVEQGSQAVSFLEMDNTAWDEGQITRRMKEQEPKLNEQTASAAVEAPRNLAGVEYGATAYASSFTLEFDPRKVLQGEPGATWKPHATDQKPRFYLTWPGEVSFDQLTLTGNLPSDRIQVWAGPSRLEMQQLAAQVQRPNNGQVALTLAHPTNARVVELRFSPGETFSLQQLHIRPAASNTTAVSHTLSLHKGGENTATLQAGELARFEIDPAYFPPTATSKPWLLEIEQLGAEPFRNFQDYRAGRALLLPGQTQAVARLSQFAVSGDYALYLSPLGTTTRTRVGTIQLQGKATPQSTGTGFPEVKLELQSHRLPNLVIEGENIPVVIMVLGAPSFEKIAGYRQTGTRLWRFNASAAPLLKTPDIAKNVQDTLAEVEQNVRNILTLAPETYLMIGLDTRPQAAWVKQYPDTLQRTTSGKMGYGVNFGSAQLRYDLQHATRLFMEALAQKPYANRIVGILPYFGRGGDGWGYGIEQAGWVKRDQIQLADRAPAEDAGFSAWLATRYGQPLSQTLKGRWPDAALSRDTLVPTDERLASVDSGLFLDPATKQDVIDYWKYRGESVATAIVEVGQQVQKSSNGRLLYGAHYGYSMSSLRNQAPGVVQLGGHFNLQEVLNSNAVSIVNGGSAGDKRDAASNYEPITPLGSALLHGKLPILELDNRTPLTRGVPPYEYYQLFSFDDFLQGAQKDIGFALTHGAAIHWYDMSSPYAANEYFREPWYFENSFYALTQQAMKLGAQPAPQSPPATPIAVFIDERVIPYQDVYNSFVYENLLRYFQESLAEAGVGFRAYLLSDYEKWSRTPEAANTKMEIFLNGWRQPEKAIVQSPRAQLWLYGSDLLSSTQLNPQPPTRQVLGYDLKQQGELSLAASRLTLDPTFRNTEMPVSYTNHPYSDFHASQRLLFGESLAAHYVPATSTGYTALARFENGTPGLVESRSEHGQRFFSSLPYLPASVLRGLYERAGIQPDVPFGDWWVAQGRGAISINTQAKVENPQPLQTWLKQHSPIMGTLNETVKPGHSYIVSQTAP